MNIYIRKLFESIDFNNSDIFNKEDSLYDDSKIDNYIYKNILKKLLNASQIYEEELKYVCKLKKYKVSSKKELIKIINNMMKKSYRLFKLDRYYIL